MDGLGDTTIHPMDAKGRVSLPAKYRRGLPDDLVIVRSPDRQFPSLRVYTNDQFVDWVNLLFDGMGGFQANSRRHNALKRRLYGGKQEVSVDQAGRIHIPLSMRQYASLEKSVVMVGVDDHVEIWDADILAQSDEFYDEFEAFDAP